MMATTSNEQRICELAAQGKNHHTIARLLGIKPASVKRIHQYLNDSPAPDRLREKKVRQGSRDLLAALQAAGHVPEPEELPAPPAGHCHTCGNTDAECTCPGELEDHGVND